jgi:AraC-like DNA-binding protein/mannose-6-phosphate isomerase-like protein (cupin superfamily)
MNRTSRHAGSIKDIEGYYVQSINGCSGSVFPNAQILHVPKKACKDGFRLVEPQIDAEGTHVWPFDRFCPVDVLFLTEDGRHQVRMNRHEYFEILYLCSGSAICHIQDRLLPVNEGDLVIVGSSLFHRIEVLSSSPITLAALFFEPDLIRGDGGSDAVEYLTPFFSQDSTFPHVVPAKTHVPREALDMMLRIRAQLPASSHRARLAVKTFLKMILMLLVNHFASYTGSLEAIQRHERALERLLPLFSHISENCGTPISVQEAGRICGMSASHFMTFFKRLTGMSFAHYFNQYRIERAQALLAGTEELLTDIALELGFCDQSYFGSVFRKHVGVTPADYRRQFRNQAAYLAAPDRQHPTVSRPSERWKLCTTHNSETRGRLSSAIAGMQVDVSALVAQHVRQDEPGRQREDNDRSASRRRTLYHCSAVFAS